MWEVCSYCGDISSLLFTLSIICHCCLTKSNEKSYIAVKDALVVVQNQLRDVGVVRDVADMSIIMTVPLMCLFQPILAYRFYKLSQRTNIIQYGPTNGHYLEVFHTSSSNNSKVNKSSSTSSK